MVVTVTTLSRPANRLKADGWGLIANSYNSSRIEPETYSLLNAREERW
jgi:hypothetical protein